MSAQEQNDINSRLALVSEKFKLKVTLTIHNARKIMEDNYRKIRSIENKISHRLCS